VLREYALLADGERGALVGPEGDLAWMCAPRWDSDAVFSSLIGGGGTYAVTPKDERYVWGGYYEDGTLIWHSRWVTTHHVTECQEALAYPGDPNLAVLLRRVVAVDAPAAVHVELDVRAHFGAKAMKGLSHQDGCWTGRSGGLYLRWTAGPGVRRSRSGGLLLDVALEAGTSHDLVLEISTRDFRHEPVQAAVAWQATRDAWSRAVPDLESTLAARDARHSYTILQGLTSHQGGMAAAVTTSLPERAEEGRNYDYRYAWIRDQCYAGQAVAVHGPHPLLDQAVNFMSERILADGPKLKPAYRVDGSQVPSERSLPRLTGYPGGFDKVGNHVNRQFQLDIFGETLLLFSAAARHDRLATEHWQALEVTVAAIESRWGDPDAGVWELEDRRWAHSRLMCVAGLRAIAACASASQAACWSRLADTILADVGRDCTHPTGRWQRAPGDGRVDAALLLPAIRGAVPVDDPRSLATAAAVASDLTSEGYAYRFRPDERPLGEAEGAFLLCGFWMSLMAHHLGRERDAIGYFERNRSACGPPGLFTEEFDVGERQLRGNVPQAFVHALLLESGARLRDLQGGW
jgi:GH15 family glucan-1,4-alpha-glucosidase